MKRWIYSGMMILIVISIFAGCNNSENLVIDAQTETGTNEVANTSEVNNSDGSTTSESPKQELSDEEKGKLFPVNFELPNGKGENIDLADHEGKILLLNFFRFCISAVSLE